MNQKKQITGMYDYMPFGQQINVKLNSSKDRLSFIGKEKDAESGLGDFGVRKYDEGGRFLSIDPLWEKYYALTPYHYCSNNPVNATDRSGMNGVKIVDAVNMTITLKAVYIYNPDNYGASDISGINDYLNQQNYSVSEGEFNGYKVKFDITGVSELPGYHETDEYNYEGVNIGNTIESKGADFHFDAIQANGSTNTISFTPQSDGSVTGGVTVNHKGIYMNNSNHEVDNDCMKCFTLGLMVEIILRLV